MRKPLNSRKEHESWKETINILRDSELMRGIREAKRDIKAGRLLSKEEVWGKAREKHSALKTVEKDLK